MSKTLALALTLVAVAVVAGPHSEPAVVLEAAMPNGVLEYWVQGDGTPQDGLLDALSAVLRARGIRRGHS